MVINDWIDRNDIPKTRDAVFLFLYLLRTATAGHLAALLGLKKHSVVQYIYRINRQGRRILSYNLGRGERVYTLLPKGVEEVAQILDEVRYYPISRRQGKHWRGLNDIFLRLIQQVGLQEFRNNLAWYTPSQAKQNLFELWNRLADWNEKERQEKYKVMLAPDGRLNILGEVSCWIEYDCASEKKTAIRSKYKEYLDRLVPIANTDPVIWICPTARRENELRKWWEELKKELESKPEQEYAYFPLMQFFVAGEETGKFVDVYNRIQPTKQVQRVENRKIHKDDVSSETGFVRSISVENCQN